jgi:hypothetical protein
LNRLVDFHDVISGGNAIQVDFDAIIFNTISSTILRRLSFKAVGGMIFSLAQPMVWNCLIVELLLVLFDCRDILVHHIQSLANVTMANIACNIL